jgi:hypothetical protein
VRTAWHEPSDTSPVGLAANLHLDLTAPNFGIQEQTTPFFSDPIQEVFRAVRRSGTAACGLTTSLASASNSTRKRQPNIRSRSTCSMAPGPRPAARRNGRAAVTSTRRPQTVERAGPPPLPHAVEPLVIGLESGSSGDGIDAALVAIKGSCETASIELRHFAYVPFHDETRQRMLELFRLRNRDARQALRHACHSRRALRRGGAARL